MTPGDDSAPPAWRLAITGGIASGKSTVAAAFARHGVAIIDTDVIAREVVAPGTSGLATVVATFGASMLQPDGTLDRRRLRQRVFADEAARQRLEAILHPLIWAEVEERSRTARRASYCAVVVPLLAESGRAGHLDRVLVVDCPPETQIERLVRRDGESPESARRILAAQATRQERLAIADDVIDNTGDRQDLEREVARLHTRYTQLAA